MFFTQPDDSSTQAYRILHEYTNTEEIKLMSWCPTMDLLALISVTSEVSIMRLSWQKVWGLLKEEGISIDAVTWRPDGKVIAFGYSTGMVKLYDVGTAELLHTIQGMSEEEPAGITCLHWVEENEISKEIGSEDFDVTQVMPQLSAIPNSGVGVGVFASKPKEGAAKSAQIAEETRVSMNLLIVGDTAGNFHLSVFGIFFLGVISLHDNSQLPVNNPRIISATISPDLSTITLLILVDGNKIPQLRRSVSDPHITASTITASSKKEGHCLLVVLDTNLLHQRKPEIRLLSQKSTLFNFLLNYIQEGLQVMETDYKTAQEITAKNYEIFEQVLRDHDASFKTPTVEYLGMLATGTPDEPLNQYLQRELTERGLKKWESQVEHGYLFLRRMAHEYLIPACERLLIHLSDINGLAKWHARFGAIGLNEEFVHNCILLSGSFIGRLEELLKVLNVDLRNFLEFTKWLDTVIVNLSPVDQGNDHEKVPINSSYVADYLQTSFTANRLEEFFLNKVDDNNNLEFFIPERYPSTLKQRPNLFWPYQSSGHEKTKPSYPYVFTFPAHLSKPIQDPTLGQYVKALNGRCKNLFAKPAKLVGQSLRIVDYISLLRDPRQDEVEEDSFLKQMRIVINGSRTYHYVAFYRPSFELEGLPPSLWFVRFLVASPLASLQASSLSNITANGEMACIPLKAADQTQRLRIMDMEFFDDKTLCILIEGIDEEEEPHVYMASFNYTSISYLPIMPGTQSPKDAHFNLVERAMSYLTLDESPIFHVEKSREITQFKSIALATNGLEGRRIASLLAEDRKRIIIFDMNMNGDGEDDEVEQDSRIEGEVEDNAEIEGDRNNYVYRDEDVEGGMENDGEDMEVED